MGSDRIERMGPDLLRVIAPNPSAFTAEGTNTWILGTSEACVIDPGPVDDRHLGAVMEALAGRKVGAILVTHAHLDHSGMAPALSERTGAPVLAFGDATAGVRSGPGPLGQGMGVDWGFRPDRCVGDGEVVEGDGWRLRAWHTPGHMGNHLCFDDGERLWTGDHAMGFATSVVSPAEGDMGDYVASLERLIALGPRSLWPGHGAPVSEGPTRLQALLDHRHARDTAVLAALSPRPRTAEEMLDAIYTGLPVGLRGAARRNLLAHLVHLVRRGLAVPDGDLSEGVAFRCVRPSDSPLDAGNHDCYSPPRGPA